MTNARHNRRVKDKLLLNGRPLRQERLEVPSTTEGAGSRSKAFEHERKLLHKRKILVEDAMAKYDELDTIFQKIHDTDKEIEKQREKQVREQ